MGKIVILYIMLVSSVMAELEQPAKYDSLEKTSEALMAVPLFAERANYLTWKLKQVTLGEELADKVLLISPFLTGRFEFSMMDLNFEVDYHSGKGEVKYVYKF